MNNLKMKYKTSKEKICIKRTKFQIFHKARYQIKLKLMIYLLLLGFQSQMIDQLICQAKMVRNNKMIRMMQIIVKNLHMNMYLKLIQTMYSAFNKATILSTISFI